MVNPSFLSYIEPSVCLSCGGDVIGPYCFCASCLKLTMDAIFKQDNLCSRCGFPLWAGEDCHFCLTLPSLVSHFKTFDLFSDDFKRYLHLYKGGKLFEMAYFYKDLFKRQIKLWDLTNSLLIPIPPRRFKVFKTGWDQVDLIYGLLKKEESLSSTLRFARALKRRDQKQQKTLNLEDRKKHVKENLYLKPGAFKKIEGQSVIIIDDVFTTGATMIRAFELIAKAQPKNVYLLALCYVL